MSKENLEMPIINPKAAGIDVGSRSHFVGIGQGKEHVREFGVYTEDLKELTQFLLDSGVGTNRRLLAKLIHRTNQKWT